jgi:hypothetical protein
MTEAQQKVIITDPDQDLHHNLVNLDKEELVQLLVELESRFGNDVVAVINETIRAFKKPPMIFEDKKTSHDLGTVPKTRKFDITK